MNNVLSERPMFRDVIGRVTGLVGRGRVVQPFGFRPHRFRAADFPHQMCSSTSAARTDLAGGRWVTIVPTGTSKPTARGDPAIGEGAIDRDRASDDPARTCHLHIDAKPRPCRYSARASGGKAERCDGERRRKGKGELAYRASDAGKHHERFLIERSPEPRVHEPGQKSTSAKAAHHDAEADRSAFHEVATSGSSARVEVAANPNSVPRTIVDSISEVSR